MLLKISADFSFFEDLFTQITLLFESLFNIIAMLLGFAFLWGTVCFFVLLIFIPFELILFKIKKDNSINILKHMTYIAPISAVITIFLDVFFI